MTAFQTALHPRMI